MTGAILDLGMRPRAVAAWRDLCHALDAALLDGIALPCQQDPDGFVCEDPGVRFVAARACADCPVRRPCDAFATANAERVGVWGGVDRDPRASFRERQCTRCGTTFTHTPTGQRGAPPRVCQPCRESPRPKLRQIPSVRERVCLRCGQPFTYLSRPGGPPKVCHPCRDDGQRSVNASPVERTTTR